MLVVVVRKVHVLKLNLAVGHLHLRRPGCIADVDVLVQQFHQLVGIDQILVHDTIECAEHVERRIHLLQVRHKHDKLRRRHAAGHDGPRHGQHREERAEGQDQILHQVEHMEAENDLVRGLLVRSKRGGEALRLERFVAVALDRLIVEEHVRRDRAARRVAAIHLAAQLGPPRRHAHTQVRVHAHDGEQDEPDHGAKRHRQVHNRDHDIDKYGREREEQVLEKVVERRAAVERADQLARLAARVVRHGQVQHAVEHEAAHVHVRVPRDRVPQQVLHDIQQATCALEQLERGEEEDRQPWIFVRAQRLDDAAQRHRHEQVDQAPKEQETDTRQRQKLQFRRLGRPQVRKQDPHTR